METLTREQALAASLMALVGGMTAATDSKTRERILICKHMQDGQKRWDTIELTEEMAAGFAVKGETWSGKLQLCEPCGRIVKTFLDSIGFRDVGSGSH